jgi:hypothetical protein
VVCERYAGCDGGPEGTRGGHCLHRPREVDEQPFGLKDNGKSEEAVHCAAETVQPRIRSDKSVDPFATSERRVFQPPPGLAFRGRESGTHRDSVIDEWGAECVVTISAGNGPMA